MDFLVTESESGLSVREFLPRRLSLSTKMLKFLKYREDGITVNGSRVTVRYRLQTGDRLSLDIRDGENPDAPDAVDLPIDILYEDDELVVPSKPAGMPTHPSRDHYRDTVANALSYRYLTRGIPFVFRPINRLDRDTSGLLLVARNKLSAGRMTDAMRHGEIHKSYLAVLEGEDCPGSGCIDRPLRRSAASIIVREVCNETDAGAEPSRTLFRVLARGDGCVLVEAKPVTGRTHQLRVHFASIGHPIVGDTLYGHPDARIGRQALHARTLTFPHPATGERMTLTAPLPDDLDTLIFQMFGIHIDRKESI